MSEYWRKYSNHYSTITRLALPIMVGQLGVIITGYADTVMVGHYATSALASASFVNNVFNFMVMLCLGFSYGLTPLVGSLYARKDCDSVGALVKNAVVANGLFAVVLLVIMWVVYMNIEHLGLPENLIPTIKPYYQLFFWSMVPVVVSNVLRQFSDAVNDTKLAMWIFTAGNLLNIAGNYVLIYGKMGAPEMGLNGAGVSTLVSRVLMAVAFVWVLAGSRRYKPYFNGFKRGVLSRKSITKVVKTSFPVSMQLGMETGIFTFASLIVGWLGEIQLAAYQVLVMLGMLGFMIYYAVGAATSIKISNYNGVGNVTGVRNAAHAGYVITLLCAIAASATFILAGRWLIMAFTGDSAVIAVAVGLIVPLVLYQFGDATQVAFANSLRGIAEVMPIMRNAFIAYVVIGLPLVYALAIPAGWGLKGIYIAFTIALFTAGMLFMRRFYHKLKEMQVSS